MRIIKYIFSLMKINLKKEMFYRSSFILKILGKVSWVTVTFIFFNIIFSRTEKICNWDEGSVYLLLGSAGIIYSFFNTFCNYGSGSISSLVRDGTIEILFLKPIPAPIFILFRFASIPELISTLVPIFVFIKGLIQTGSFNIFSFILWFLSILLSFFIYSFIHLLLGLLAFKFIRINPLFHILDDFADFGKYPYFIFPKLIRFFFLYIIPILLITNYPVLIFLGGYYLIIHQLFLLIILIFLIWLFFPISRKIYQGTGTYEF